jgi:hypothetical protein
MSCWVCADAEAVIGWLRRSRGPNGAVRGMPAGAAAGWRVRRHIWLARVHRRHTYATLLPSTLHGIRAYFENLTQITCYAYPCPRKACTGKLPKPAQSSLLRSRLPI